jgi:hypothetical protein
MTTARAFYDFAKRYNATGMTWSPRQIGEMYPVAHAEPQLLFAEAMFAYVMSCDDASAVTCKPQESKRWLDLALQHYDDIAVCPLTSSACAILKLLSRLELTIAKSFRAACAPCIVHCLRTAIPFSE